MTRYAGIDPGLSGAIALMSHSHRTGHKVHECLDMPVMKEQLTDRGKVRKEPDFDEMIELFFKLKRFNPGFVMLERVWGQIDDSAQTAFSLGGSFKLLRGLLHTQGFAHAEAGREAYYLTAPAQWKRWKPYQKWGLWGAGDDSKAIAIDMFNGIFPGDNTELLCPLRKGSTTRRNKPADGRADAALIGLFGACELMGLPLPKTLEPERALVGADGRCNLF